MHRGPYRPNTSIRFANGKGNKRLPAVILAVLLIALAIFISGAVAQKSGDLPVRDPIHNGTNTLRTIHPLPQEKYEKTTPQVFRAYTISIVENCNLKPLLAYLDDMLAEGKLAETPVRVHSQIRVVTGKEQLRDLSAVSCVADIAPGWQVTPLPLKADGLSSEGSLSERHMSDREMRETDAAAGTGSISGTVTAESGGALLAEVIVCATSYDGSLGPWPECVETDTNGHYSITGLGPGTYLVEFYDNSTRDYYAWEYYEDATDVNSATLIPANRGSSITGIDAALAEGGHITGTVTTDFGGLPANEIHVCAYYDDGMDWKVADCGYVDIYDTGHYTLNRLQTANYRVKFGNEEDNGFYAFEFYSDAPTIINAADISVTAGSTISGIDVSLADAGEITGTITAASSGALLDDTVVCAYFDDGYDWWAIECYRYVTNGIYLLGGLQTGAYRLGFFDDLYGYYAIEYYDDARSIDSGTDVPVTAGSRTTGIDAALNELGHVTGTVTAETGGAPLQSIEVCAYSYADGIWYPHSCDYTDTNGNYDIEFWWLGDYRLKFTDNQGNYAPEYFDDVSHINDATDISVTPDNIISGINAALADAGHISGTVTADGSGAPLSDISVCAVYDNGSYWQDAGCGYSDISGSYNIDLPDGTYRLLFSDAYGFYVSEYYNNVPDLVSATDISVTAGNTTSGINASLAEFGSITGRVTAESNGSPLYDIAVWVYRYTDSYWNYIGGTSTDQDGQYTYGSLEPGTYRVEFYDWRQIYLKEVYDDVLILEDGTDILISSGSNISGIDGTLTEAGHVTGTVTAETGGALLEDIEACAYSFDGAFWQNRGCNYTNAGGDYDISGLQTDTYRVQFSDYSGSYLNEYFNGASNIDAADDISVSIGNTTAGINASLIDAGHISGIISAEAGGALLEDIEACAYSFDGSNWQYQGCDYSDAAGTFNISGLRSGTYRVGFFDYYYGSYLTEYYDNALDVYSAMDITVTAGSTTAGIDAVLTEPGHITGTLTAEVGGTSLVDIKVCALSFNGAYWEYAGICGYSDANGDYDISGLVTGAYRIEFYDSSNSYQIEYYDNELDIDSAADVSVTVGSTTAGVDAALAATTHTPPDNDDIDAARTIGSIPYQDTLDSRDATIAVDDPLLPCGPSHEGYGSVWYSITPQQGSLLNAHTFGSNYDTVLTVWEGSRGSLTDVACNDDTGSLQSQLVDVPLAGGVTYYIEVAGYNSNLGKLVLTIDLTPDTPFAECVSNTGNDATMAVPDTVSVLGGLSLEPGDEIALYTTNRCLCAGHGAWTGGSLGLSAWGDNIFTDTKDGFAAGEPLHFRIWDRSTDTIYSYIRAHYSVGDGLYSEDNIYVISQIDVNPGVFQDIHLLAGWNMMSSFVIPQNPALVTLMLGVENEMILMKNGDGQVYWPSQGINDIGNWDVRDGYQIYMNSPAVLTITGQEVDPTQTPIDLLPGWSMAAYLPNSCIPVEQALSIIGGELVNAKNSFGKVYWPAYEVNQIGDMQPGHGYKMNVDAPATLIYPDERHPVGDINQDCAVDSLDYDILQAAFNSSPGDANWNPLADFNNSRMVDIFDYNILLQHFGETCSTGP